MIEIPGYKIIKQLGRGGMATVYLALQESVDREVALKVMSPALMVDPNFGERFLREARIAAKLHHRHVVGVHDVGKHKDIHYIAMEYLPGGSLKIEDKKPLEATFVLRIVREIATALGYAHTKGFVHRDVKPDNILLHDDGTAALTDFGIARASDSATRMTRTGSVIGTPYYMSPEQARGRPLDGRADLYSLGVVLYEMLTGSVPYMADDPLAIGIMHITEPVPRLPAQYASLQGLFDRMMAKLPEERFQSGEEIAEVIRELELDIAEGLLPQIAVPNDNYRRRVLADHSRTQRMQSATPKPDMRTGRAEPSLGKLDEAMASDRRPRVPTPVPRAPERKWWPIVLGVMVVLVIGAGVLFREPIGKLLTPSDVAENLAKAETAVRENRLYEGPDNARELYQKVLSVDPDNSAALSGLTNVGNALLGKANDRLSANDFVGARKFLAMSKDILGGGLPIEQLESNLNDKEKAAQDIEDLMLKAQTAMAEKRFTGIDGALDLFGRILDADSANMDAVKGQQDALNEVIRLASEAIDAKDLIAANGYIEEIARITQNHVALPDLRARVASQQADAAESLESDLRLAEQMIGEGALYAPANRNALAVLNSVLARDPNNLRAKQTLSRIAGMLITQARAALESSDLEGARRLLQRAEQLGASAAELKALRTELREASERREIQQNTRVLTVSEMSQIQTLLSEAARLGKDGNLIDPPGDNAYDKYRKVLSMDRNNATAKAGVAELPKQAKILFEQALTGERLNSAYQYVDTVIQLAPTDPTSADMRMRLAVAYVEQARKRLSDGQIDNARKAIARAKELQADAPGVAEVSAQLGAM